MAGCERPVAKVEAPATEVQNIAPRQEEKKNMVMVGKPAPTFTAPAYYKGEFAEINLEDYKGHWVMLCFYPGDFTFV